MNPIPSQPHPQQCRVLLTGIQDTSLLNFKTSLQSLNVFVESIPLIETRYLPVSLPETDITETVEWVFFTSKNAVHAYFQNSDTRRENFQIAVLGSATASVLTLYGKQASFIAPQPNAKSAAESFLLFLNALADIRPGTVILWPCGNLAYPDLGETLQAGGCRVISLTVYETKPSALTSEQRKRILQEPWDYIVFASASAVRAYQQLLQSVQPEPVLDYPAPASKSIAILACLGRKTQQVVEDSGFPNPCIVAAHSNYQGLLECLPL